MKKLKKTLPVIDRPDCEFCTKCYRLCPYGGPFKILTTPVNQKAYRALMWGRCITMEVKKPRCACMDKKYTIEQQHMCVNWRDL